MTISVGDSRAATRFAAAVIAALVLGYGSSAEAEPRETLWSSYFESGSAALKQGQLEKAQKVLELALQEAVEFNADDPRLKSTFEALSSLYRKKGDDQMAAKFEAAAKEGNTAFLNLKQPQRRLSPEEQADDFFERKDFDAAELRYKELLNTASLHDSLRLLDKLARVYWSRNDFKSVKETLLRATDKYELLQKMSGVGQNDELQMARILRRLARTYYRLGETYRSQALYEKALSIQERLVGKTSPEVMVTLSDYALACSDSSDFDTASVLYKRAIDLSDRLPTSNQELIDTVFQNYYKMLSNTGKTKELSVLSAQMTHRNIPLPDVQSSSAATMGRLADNDQNIEAGADKSDIQANKPLLPPRMLGTPPPKSWSPNYQRPGENQSTTKLRCHIKCVTQQRIDFSQYIAKLTAIIEPKLDSSSTVQRKVEISLDLAKKGTINRVSILVPSGDSKFDDVMKALILDCEPFPPMSLGATENVELLVVIESSDSWY